MGKQPCPNSYAGGCRCPDHELGLMAYAPDPEAFEAQLAPLRPVVRLRAVAPLPAAKPHRGELSEHQPWMPRPARQRKAA